MKGFCVHVAYGMEFRTYWQTQEDGLAGEKIGQYEISGER